MRKTPEAGWRKPVHMLDQTAARQHMVDSQLRARGVVNARVLNAMLRVPRHLFVPDSLRAQAYEDHPLPIGNEQTISQPFIVARMLEFLGLMPTDKVLEVGTGSGYVAALLAELAGEVFTIERHSSLAERARQTLAMLGYNHARVITGDGSLGLQDHAPYHAILVSAAALELPPALVAQLIDPGRMIIPVGSADSQQLQFVRRVNGGVNVSLQEQVRFVPLIGNSG
jgi:protein-L-isoaspartate(D-aspartate) O-methyltransferase